MEMYKQMFTKMHTRKVGNLERAEEKKKWIKFSLENK